MDVLFLGTDSVLPAMDNDTACCVIDGDLLLDFGWHGACQMEAHGVEPWNVLGALLTHVHQDHYMGMVPFLFYNYLRQSQRTVDHTLQIGGPANSIASLVGRAKDFMLEAGPALPFPELDIAPLEEGGQLTVGELAVTAGPSSHNVDAMSYRITREEQGQKVTVVYSGDTGYCEDLIAFASGADLLVHESSRGVADPISDCAHSSVGEACRVATEAGVKALALVHMTDKLRAPALEQARDLMSVDCFTPLCGDRLEVVAGGVKK
jgi:ribonuclease BN (tRNA processing enzyme)